MSSKLSGLGRGLDFIFMQNNSETKDTPVTLKLTEIIPNASQPRYNFNSSSLQELADSISKYGLIQPIMVRPNVDGTYKIIAGERRWRASKLAGLDEVPVVIKEVDDLKLMEMALIENLQRENLCAVEEAKSYKFLIEKYNLTQEELSKNLGKSRSHIANTLRLLELPKGAIEKLENNEITPGHARALLSLGSHEAIEQALSVVISQKLSVRQTEELVKKILQSQENHSESKKKVQDEFFLSIERKLESKFGRKINIVNGKNKGVLKIEFHGKEDLSKICHEIFRNDL